MSNEELAILIQQGHYDYFIELWKKTKQLLFYILHKKMYNYPLPNYITWEDLEQQMYFALYNAVQAYDDTKPYKFNTYLEYNVMNAIHSALPNKPLHETSYNQTTGEDEDTELIEFIEDFAAVKKFKDIETKDLYQQLYKSLSKLTPVEKDVVIKHSFMHLTYDKIAKCSGKSQSQIVRTHQKALYKLRKDRELSKAYMQTE